MGIMGCVPHAKAVIYVQKVRDARKPSPERHKHTQDILHVAQRYGMNVTAVQGGNAGDMGRRSDRRARAGASRVARWQRQRSDEQDRAPPSRRWMSSNVHWAGRTDQCRCAGVCSVSHSRLPAASPRLQCTKLGVVMGCLCSNLQTTFTHTQLPPHQNTPLCATCAALLDDRAPG